MPKQLAQHRTHWREIVGHKAQAGVPQCTVQAIRMIKETLLRKLAMKQG